MTANDFPLRLTVGAVFFDIDGTLADTDPLHARAWAEAIRQAGSEPFTVAQYVQACIDGSMTPAEFVRPFLHGVDPESLRPTKAAAFAHLLEGADLNPGVAEFLADLRSAEVPLGLVSSSSKGSVRSFLEALWPLADPPEVLNLSRQTFVLAEP